MVVESGAILPLLLLMALYFNLEGMAAEFVITGPLTQRKLPAPASSRIYSCSPIQPSSHVNGANSDAHPGQHWLQPV